MLYYALCRPKYIFLLLTELSDVHCGENVVVTMFVYPPPPPPPPTRAVVEDYTVRKVLAISLYLTDDATAKPNVTLVFVR